MLNQSLILTHLLYLEEKYSKSLSILLLIYQLKVTMNMWVYTPYIFYNDCRKYKPLSGSTLQQALSAQICTQFLKAVLFRRQTNSV